jgi:hypothetical protein
MSIKLSGVSTLHNLGQKEMQKLSDAKAAALFTAQFSTVIEARFNVIEVPDVGAATACYGVHLVAVEPAVPVELRGVGCFAHVHRSIGCFYASQPEAKRNAKSPTPSEEDVGPVARRSVVADVRRCVNLGRETNELVTADVDSDPRQIVMGWDHPSDVLLVSRY